MNLRRFAIAFGGLLLVYLLFIAYRAGDAPKIAGTREVAGPITTPPPESMLKGWTLYVFTDPRTGCQYVGDGHSIYPRMTKEGKQLCQ